MKIQILKLPSNRKALGGTLQTHGSDFSNGLMSIEAGSTHENNPYDGVQLGVDLQGTPNLVEEGETVWDDYVFSNRLICDDKTKAMFHISKKTELTFATLSKKLEKESEERPNDPVSAAALKAQMQDLADQQERQKQEMEAERAEEAFNALSDEEKVALMQQAAEQEQMAQEQAMAEEQAAMQQPSPEEMTAMGQQMSPEEAAMMQQQMAAQGGMPMGEPVPEGYAYGGELGENGNVFDLGGDIDKWLVTKGVKPEHYEAIKKAIEKGVSSRRYKSGGMAPYNVQTFETILDNIMKGKDNIVSKNTATYWRSGITDRHRKHFNYLVNDLGMDRETAFALSMPDYEDFAYIDKSKEAEGRFKKDLESEYLKLVGNNTSSPSPAQTSVETNQSAAAQQRKQAIDNARTSQKPGYSAPLSEYRVENGRRVVYPYKNVKYPTAEAANEAAGRTIYAVEGKKSEEVTPAANASSGKGTATLYPNITPYAYSDSWEGFDYYNPETKQYDPNYSKFAKGISQDWVNRIFSEGHPYGDMSRYLEKNSGYMPTPQEVASLATDGRYSDMHKAVAQAYQDYLNHVDPVTGQIIASPTEGQPVAAKPLEEVYPDVPIPSGRAAKMASISRNDMSPLPDDSAVRKDAVATSPTVAAPAATKTEPETKIVPNLMPDTYYGVFGAGIPLLMQLAGVGKPDTSEFDAIMANAARAYHTASNKYLGNYMKYKPLDTWFTQAKIDAQARATDRAIGQSGTNQGAKIAGFLQNGYNSQLASGEALRADNKYNREDEFKTGEFNRGTDMFNAQAYNQLSQFNAEQANRAGQYTAQLGLNAAAQKADLDRWFNSNLYQNVNAVVDRVNQWEKWKRDHNTIAKMAADQLFGVLGDKQYSGLGFVKRVPAANGGPIKKKKGKKKGGLTV